MKYEVKTIASGKPRDIAALRGAEDEVAALVADGWTVESSRATVVESADVYRSETGARKTELYDYCWILKRAAGPSPLNS